MKSLKLIFPFILLFCFQQSGISQNKISKKSLAVWKPAIQIWYFKEIQEWRYDENGKIIYNSQNRKFNPGSTDFDNTEYYITYNPSGSLAQRKIEHSNQIRTRKVSEKYVYNDQNIHTEILSEEIRTNPLQKNYQKTSYEHYPAENRRTKKKFEKNEPNSDWVLKNQTDDFYNESNCTIEYNQYTFKEDGTIATTQIYYYERLLNCVISSINIYRVESNSNDTIPVSQYIYETDGNISTTTYKVFNSDTEQLELKRIDEKEYNDERKVIRDFQQKFRPMQVDSIMYLTTYNADGRQETFEIFSNYNSLFQLARSDTFIYYINLDQQLVEATTIETFHTSEPIPERVTTLLYNYYCDGQLKSETYLFNDEKQSLTVYEYVGGVNCPLAETDDPILIFPNPSQGNFTVQSNLFAESAVDVQVFNMLGQEVFSGKSSGVGYQFHISLPDGLKGNFIVSISNGEKRLTSKMMVF